MTIDFPSEKKIEIHADIHDFHSASESNFGAIAIVEAVHIALQYQGFASDRMELLAVSSVLFNNYVYYHGYNQHVEVKKYRSRYAELISNYGICESLSHFTGYEISEVNGWPADAFWKLIQFEMLNDRLLVTLDKDLRTRLIVGYKIDETGQREVYLSDGASVPFETPFQGHDEVFVNWSVIVRPGEKKAWAAPESRQKMNMLRWVVQHGFGSKEFFQETRENYAVGLHGLKILKEQLKHADADFQTFFLEYLQRWIHARTLASDVLAKWASKLAGETEKDVEKHLLQASEAFRELAESWAGDSTLHEKVTQMIEKERKALEAIKEAAEYFPSIFGE